MPTTKKATAKKTAAKATTTKRATPVALDAKIIVNKAKAQSAIDQLREGSGHLKRVKAVLASNGKTVEDAVKKGARRSTVRHLAEGQIIRVA